MPAASTKIDRRIIPISSGKGGVGKTTFALNYALTLSQYGRTVLIDLDMGTSSIRNCLDTPVSYDLYHFFKQKRPLIDCVTTLDPKLDPEGRFSNFGFIASPKHLIDEITNLNRARREKLIDAINSLDVPYVVLDLKAGLDSNVIEFLPYSNSGILVFTPHLPAATMAASDIVKAILFRKLRTIFAKGSAIYKKTPGMGAAWVNELIDQAEDNYDPSVPNLDHFALEISDRLGEHEVVQLVVNTIHFFRVHYVLNMFNGVKESFETAVKPFVQNLVENVSANMTIVNLGWVMQHEDIAQAAIRRVPIVLAREKVAQPSGAQLELNKLAAQYIGSKPKASTGKTDVGRFLETQLDTLKKMHSDLKGTSYRSNFKYIAARSLHVMSSRRYSDFGDNRIFKKAEFQRVLMHRGR